MTKTLSELGVGIDTDKTESAGYVANYTRHFEHLRGQPIKLLELGVLRGGSLLLWQAYFPKGTIVGLDLNPNPLPSLPDRVAFYQGSQDDAALLDRVAREQAPEGFDIIIDDASHLGRVSRSSFAHLFNRHLKPGGLYVVEDWGTGYWGDWPDGQRYQPRGETPAPRAGLAMLKHELKSRLSERVNRGTSGADPDFTAHNFGMVGFVKELVDLVAWDDIVRPVRGNPGLPPPPSRVKEMAIYPGQTFLTRG